MSVNRYGLARNIPEPVKRIVRQACGFGCVICGNPFIEYHHTGVAYANASSHDPNKITLLCAGCHSRVTRGTLSDEAAQEHMARPYCLTNGPLGVDLDYGNQAPNVIFAASKFENCRYPIRVGRYAMIMLENPENPSAPPQLSAIFTNRRSEIILVISRNELKLMPTNWDSTIEGTRIQIWDAERKPTLTLNIAARQPLIIERIESSFLDIKFSGDENKLTVTGNKCNMTFSNCSAAGSNVGFQF